MICTEMPEVHTPELVDTLRVGVASVVVIVGHMLDV